MDSGTLDGILATIPLATVCIGENERVISANDAACELLGKGLLGRHYVAGLRQPALLDCIEDALQRKTASQVDFAITQARRETNYRVHAVPVSATDGAAVIVSFVDITPQQQAGQIRRDFVANVSHELRSPLTSLLGFIETLRGAAREDADVRDRFLGIMQREAERMNRLVHDLLSLSRVESDERVRPTAAVNVVDIVNSAAQSLRPAAEKAEVQIVIRADEPVANAPGDADQLMQVFSNLVENAIKYGAKPGTVIVSIRNLEHEPMVLGAAVQVDVQDQGQGIGALHIPRLTERFYRVDGHRSREMGGTGLGLAIVKHIINRHRGRLRISSEKGKGSLFSVILPKA